MIHRSSNHIDLDAARLAAEKVVEIHRRLVAFLRAGQTLADIDTFVAKQLEDLGCKSCFLHYRVPRLPPFPSFACLSPNDCIVHGTAGMTTDPLEPGDIISIDIGVLHRGWIGDAAWTYAIEHADHDSKRLMAAGKESLRRGVAELRPGATFRDWAAAVQQHVQGECGLYLTKGLCGHGIGRKLHLPPNIPNTVEECAPVLSPIRPGLLVAVEPMLAVGTGEKREKPNEWPIWTADGSRAVHYEHDVYVSEDGPIVLTEGLVSLPDIVGV